MYERRPAWGLGYVLEMLGKAQLFLVPRFWVGKVVQVEALCFLVQMSKLQVNYREKENQQQEMGLFCSFAIQRAEQGM